MRIHPGYGFLSENATFAESCEAAGIAFIGPTPQQMRDFGLKHTARALALSNNVPLLPGSNLLKDLAEAQQDSQANRLPRHAEKHGGRRRHWHAADLGRDRISGRV
jgi:urea carboxylase